MSRPELILIRGLPGSGKTTLAKTRYPYHTLCEADEFFLTPGGDYRFDRSRLTEAHRASQDKAKMALSAGLSVVVANTFTEYWEIAPYVEIASALSAECWVLNATGQYPNTHNVPTEAVEKMRQRFEDIPNGEIRRKNGRTE